ncbi:hypothetical protein [Paenibacillus sp. 23TSA30-6]|uniref:hypothetical protein n=1 Tax=Paenibacillus sp. 23TSA30-6 TaxID=2546104 RepID=UPI0017881350|nr:hypothetical protein [Paenibacillus sp. 23TSA30-6]MBE0336604.1 hypothetical protein [Paenibacillus sp. 23TSA30-6]
MTDGQGTTSYAYDPADGALTGLKYPEGTQITYEYNKQSRTGYVLTDASGTSMYVQSKLDSLGQVTQMDISGGAGTANMQNLAGASAAAGGSLDSMTFDYAPNGLLKGQSSSRGLSTRFSYNGLDLSGLRWSKTVRRCTNLVMSGMGIKTSSDVRKMARIRIKVR